MIPDEAVHPPFEPTPEEANPWDHIAPKFTGVPRHFDHVVDDILKPHGGSMKTFLQALDDAKVDSEDMVTLTDALEGIDAFLKSPPKDPDFEHMQVKEIDLDVMGIMDPIIEMFGTNEGDIVVVTEKSTIRFDKDGHLLFNKEIRINSKNLLYEPIHDAVFFIQRSTDRKTFSLHELNRNGDVSEPLYTQTLFFDVLVAPEGDLVFVEEEGMSDEDQPVENTKISRFNLDDKRITATHNYPVNIDGTHVLRGGMLLIDRWFASQRGIQNLDFFDTKTGMVRKMHHTDQIDSIYELPDGKIVCNGLLFAENGSEKETLDIIDPRTATRTGGTYTDMDGKGITNPNRFDILPSGKLLKIAFKRINPADNTGGFWLQTWDTHTDTVNYVYLLSDQQPENFCTAPNGNIIMNFRKYWSGGKRNRMVILS